MCRFVSVEWRAGDTAVQVYLCRTLPLHRGPRQRTKQSRIRYAACTTRRDAWSVLANT